MPHLFVEYSANLEPDVDIGALCNALRLAAIETGVFPMPGVRVRAFKADHLSMADGDPKHGYIDVMIKLRGGRTMDQKKHATTHVFVALEAFMAPHMQMRSIALSLEMRDIDPELSPKSGNIRQHLKG